MSPQVWLISPLLAPSPSLQLKCPCLVQGNAMAFIICYGFLTKLLLTGFRPPLIYPLHQKLTDLFCKGAESKYFSLWGHRIFVTTRQLCHCSAKAVTDNIQMNACGCVPIKSNLEKQELGRFHSWAIVCRPLFYIVSKVAFLTRLRAPVIPMFTILHWPPNTMQALLAVSGCLRWHVFWVPLPPATWSTN